MHQSSNPGGRKRCGGLASDMRRQIVEGQFAPGDRLPTRDELARQYGASKHTVQSALASLCAEGFVCARTKAGTFVVDRPPHMTRHALVFPMRISHSRFYEALREAGRRIAAGSEAAFVEYVQDVDADMAQLREDAREHRLAGAVFVHAINRMWSSPMMTEPGAPKVLIQSSSSLPLPDLHVDTDSFYRRAFGLAAQAGRRRAAVIYGDVPWGQWPLERFGREAATFGLRVEPYWLAPMSGAPATTVAFAVRVLLALEGERRPDVLIIGDDNYVLPAAGGLMSSNVRVPEDLLVIAHTNYPMPVDAPGLPVQHLGFDCEAMLRHAVAILGAQRSRRPVNPAWLAPLPAHTPDELEISVATGETHGNTALHTGSGGRIPLSGLGGSVAGGDLLRVAAR